ncbi:MAG TPA: 2-oxo acid dehydrogenase subunit E2, partial [Myxococcota bacterium]
MESSRFGVNASYVESLRAQWMQDPSSVAEEWSRFFADEGSGQVSALLDGSNGSNGNGNGHKNGSVATPSPLVTSLPRNAESVLPQQAMQAQVVERIEVRERRSAPITPSATDKPEVLRGIAAKIAENMAASLELPTAMSTRVMPVKVLEENRRVINSYLEDDARPRASFTHIIAWALVRAAQTVPSMNYGFTFDDKGQPLKLVREDVNLGLAIDLPARGGGRTLVVPNIKAAQKLDFRGFLDAYNDLINRSRKGGLGPKDFDGTTMT